MDLPAEILTQIFELAINDPNLFDVSLPTCMTESHWEPDKMGDGWVLINPVDFAYQKPMKNYAATKVRDFYFYIVSTKYLRAFLSRSYSPVGDGTRSALTSFSVASFFKIHHDFQHYVPLWIETRLLGGTSGVYISCDTSPPATWPLPTSRACLFRSSSNVPISKYSLSIGPSHRPSSPSPMHCARSPILSVRFNGRSHRQYCLALYGHSTRFPNSSPSI